MCVLLCAVWLYMCVFVAGMLFACCMVLGCNLYFAVLCVSMFGCVLYCSVCMFVCVFCFCFVLCLLIVCLC